MAFDRTYFHPTYLDLFWSMIAERMRIYYRREEGLAPPWTNDPVMRTEFITNVYRELDPGTHYVIDNILAFDEESPEDKLFNIFVYRLMGSRESTHEALGFLRCDEYNAGETRKILKSLEVPFGEAYRTASYVDQGSKDKITNVSRLFGKFAEETPGIWQTISDASSVQDAFKVLEGIKGFGEFLAYQILVDMLYPAPTEPLIPFTQNEWAQAGPGARKGAWKLMKPGMKPGSILVIMQWLYENQASEFERLGLDIQYMTDDEGVAVPISLCNIQSCLCEFFKYTRIWDGTLRYARKYNYSDPLDGVLAEPPLTFPMPDDIEPIYALGGVVSGATVGTPDALEPPGYMMPLASYPALSDGETIELVSEDPDEIVLSIKCNRTIRKIALEF